MARNNSGVIQCAPSDVAALRLKIRAYARQQRKDLRTNATDTLRFGLGHIQDEITELESLGIKDVYSIANRIKRRKHADTEDMYRLSHAFLQDNANINAFAEVPGAMQVIVKELTSNNVQRQIEAVELLCNLSLGERHVSEKISRLAGSYLVTYLDRPEKRLTRSCLWTVANIIDTSRVSADILLQMQLVTKLWKLYTTPLNHPHVHHEDAALCLYLIAKGSFKTISAEDRKYIARHLHKKHSKDPGAEYYMFILYQLEIITKERDLSEPHFQHLVNFFMCNFEFDRRTSAGVMRVEFGVHLLSNMFGLHVIKPITQLDLQLDRIVSALNQVFAVSSPLLTVHTLNLLKNIMETNLVDNEQLLEQMIIRHYPSCYTV